MNSVDLARDGLKEWHRFTRKDEHLLIASLPNRPGIYVIRSAEQFGRLSGQSDVCYIGSAVNMQGIKGRIRQYFHPGPTQRTNLRILSLVEHMGNLEIAFIVCANTTEAIELEKQLLSKYIEDHRELPPFNRRE